MIETAPLHSTVVFPGQGSQRAGMGRDFAERFAASRRVYEEASDALGLDLCALCCEGDERLGRTEYCQPALLATEIAMLRGLSEELGFGAERFGGHSLGEYTALVAAGVIPLAAAVRIVRARGQLMQEAVPVGAGGMVAVLGPALDRDRIEHAIATLEVVIANDNSPDQVVLSGTTSAIAEATRRLGDDAPDLRCVALEVSAPFHSPLMVPIEAAFAEVLHEEGAGWDATRAPAVTSNLTGDFHDGDLHGLRARLVGQISGRVRWRDNMAALTARPTAVVEIGPGRPLKGFFKAIGVAVSAITDVRTAERVLAGRVAA